MSYQRVIPRDLFNESKLLKCLGQLSLHFHNHEGQFSASLKHSQPNRGFIIRQNQDDGSLYCENFILRLKTRHRRVKLNSVYNSKAPFPLWFSVVLFGDEIIGDVFYNDGQFTEEFLMLIKQA